MKQTLYRTNSDSPVAEALLEAAGKKEVTVVVELKASFDEASNIRWARSLEDAGVQVFHGLANLKTHAKLALDCAPGSGWKNPPLRASWHRQLQSLDRALLQRFQFVHRRSRRSPSAVNDVFNFLTAYAEKAHYRPLLVAPKDMAKTVHRQIDREARHARRGRPARIIAKCNAVVDPPVIRALVPGLASGCRDRPDRARTMHAGAGPARDQQPHPREQHRGSFSGAQPHLLF